MKKVILDTSFILTCVKQKIYFFDEIKLMGIQIIIPKQVISELIGLTKSNSDAELSLKILKLNSFEEIDLKTKNTDNGIINFAKKNKKIIVATLDKEIKNKTKNSKLIIRKEKRLEII